MKILATKMFRMYNGTPISRSISGSTRGKGASATPPGTFSIQKKTESLLATLAIFPKKIKTRSLGRAADTHC